MRKRWTFIEIVTVLIIVGTLLVLAVGRCKAAELPMKIDTIDSTSTGVYIETIDSVICGIDPPSACRFYFPCPCLGYHPRSNWTAVIEYTTDTTYRLTEGQLKLLEWVYPTFADSTVVDDGWEGTVVGGRKLSRVINLPNWSGIRMMNLPNARIDSLVEVVDGLQSLIQFHRSSPTDHNVRSYNDSIRPEWNLGKPLKQKTPDRE